MKQPLLAVLGLGLATSLWAAEDNSPLKTPKDKMSYGVGMDIARTITNVQVEVNPDALAAGLKAMLTGSKSLLNDLELQEALNAFRTERQTKAADRAKHQAEQAREQTEKVKAAGEKIKREGETFLAENKKKEGVITLPSGLQYKVYAAGTGRKPASNDTVASNYRGTFIDGKEFDSSYRTSGPVTFPVNRVIKGWQEALQLMPVGSKWKLFVPPGLAYGEVGQPPKIPGNSVLLFDLELVGIEEPTNKVDQAQGPK